MSILFMYIMKNEATKACKSKKKLIRSGVDSDQNIWQLEFTMHLWVYSHRSSGRAEEVVVMCRLSEEGGSGGRVIQHALHNLFLLCEPSPKRGGLEPPVNLINPR